MKVAAFIKRLTWILSLEKEINNWMTNSVFQKICLGISFTRFVCVCVHALDSVLNSGNGL